MSEWNYGDAYRRHPIPAGSRVQFADGSIVQAADLFDDPIPSFLFEADLLCIDPPWTTGNLTSFYTKAGQLARGDFPAFLARLFTVIGQIAPKVCYIEIGKAALADVIVSMRRLYPTVTFYNSMYYRRPANHCYWVRGGPKRIALPLDGLDEADIIQWIAAHEDYTCLGDLCMGRGLVGLAAFAAHRRFVGIELNPKRLSVLVESMVKEGGTYTLVPITKGGDRS